MLRGGRAKWGGLALAVAVLVVLAAVSVIVGTQRVTIGDVIRTYIDFDGSNAHLIVRHRRVPRTLLGVLVGAALGAAGVLVQGVTRNPLADPAIMGISAGASLAVVLAIATFGITSLSGYVWFAFAGAAAAGAVVYGLASQGRGGASPVKLALAGAAVSAFLGAITSGITLVRAGLLERFRFWTVGSLGGADGALVTRLTPFVVVGLGIAVASTRALNALALGDDMASTLGQRVTRARALVAIAVVVLAGAATAAAGPIGFVALTVPHAVRTIVGSDHRWLLPWSMVVAPILLLAADVFGRLAVRPQELQVGLVTAVVGAPFFIVLVRRRHLSDL